MGRWEREGSRLPLSRSKPGWRRGPVGRSLPPSGLEQVVSRQGQAAPPARSFVSTLSPSDLIILSSRPLQLLLTASSSTLPLFLPACCPRFSPSQNSSFFLVIPSPGI